MEQEIKKFNIDDLRAAEYNPRKMPDSEMQKLRRSIREYGFVQNIVLNQHSCDECGDRMNIVIGGHQRLEAAKQEGYESVPARVVDVHLRKEQALNLALNKISGTWDDEKLGEVISAMHTDPEIASTGFGENEVSRILDSVMGYDEEQLKEEKIVVPEEPKSALGEVYQLGQHRLVCGDATDPAIYEKLFSDEGEAHMVFTDPPYNVDYHSRGAELNDDQKGSIKNDALNEEQFGELIRKSFEAMFTRMRRGGSFYICSGWSSYPVFYENMLKHGFTLSGVIIWVKNTVSMGWNDYRYKHEWVVKARKDKKKPVGEAVIYGWKEGDKHIFNSHGEFDVWEMPRKASIKYLHPTEKPDWLAMRAIRNSTKRDSVVLDPFAGSGSTLAAAEKTGRRAFLIEMDPKWCDVIRQRYALFENSNERK